MPQATASLAAQVLTLDTLSLANLPGVYVVIEPVPDEAIADGLDLDSLQGMIEAKLHDAGIRLFTEDEWQVTIGSPLLRVNFNLLRPSEYFYLYFVQVDLRQLVVLARDSTIPAFGPTWSAGGALGTVPSAQIGSLAFEVLRQVDRFIDAYAVAQRRRDRWVRIRDPSA